MKLSTFFATAGLAVLVSVCLAPPAHAQVAPTPSVAAKQRDHTQAWREDLRFFTAEMQRRHRNLYHTVSPEAFARAVADLDARIPSLQRHEIIVGLMRIAALVGDGHTRVDPRKDAKFGFPSLPLKLYLFEDGLYVRAAAPAHAALVGSRVEAIGGVSVDEAIRRAAEITSRDNAIGPRLFAPLYLGMPHILHALKLSPSTGAAVLTLRKDGVSRTVTVATGEVEPLWPPDTDISLVTPAGWVDARTTPQPPLWLQAPLSYHRLIELPERQALYAQLNMVTDIEGQTLAAFGRRIGERVRATRPRALVLDLRLNQGGNGDLRHEFVRELIRASSEETRLFVLTWRGTFSASQFILDDLRRLGHAVIVGEPAGSRPSSYGDSYRTLLPNSGIQMRTSILWWQEGQNTDPWTWVDVAAPLKFDDYARGIDPALEAALTFAPVPSLGERLLAAGRQGGADAVRRGLAAFQEDSRTQYADHAGQISHAALYLHEQREAQLALLVAEHGAAAFPSNVDGFSILASLAESAGQLDRARSAAEAALMLDANNRFVRSLLERLSRGR